MTATSRNLTEISERIGAAKTKVFKLQDLADALGDKELKKRLSKARDWLEASDRQALSLYLATIPLDKQEVERTT